MTVIILLLAASISVSAIFLAGFIWSVQHKQFDDDYSPPVRILFEDGVSGADRSGQGPGNTQQEITESNQPTEYSIKK